MIIFNHFKIVSGLRAGIKLASLTLLICLPPVKLSSEAPLAEVIQDELSSFLRGDCSGDGILDMTDVVMVLQVVFVGNRDLPCEAACDLDGNGRNELADIIQCLRFFMHGVIEPIHDRPMICGPARFPFELGCRDGCFRQALKNL